VYKSTRPFEALQVSSYTSPKAHTLTKYKKPKSIIIMR